MNCEFESDYRSKVLFINFTEPYTLSSNADVLRWRSQWTQALSSWHSPYKALIDCSNLSVAADADLEKSFETMMAFLKGFFLKKAVGFGYSESQGHDLLPFSVLSSEDEARAKAGLRGPRQGRKGETFRSKILLDNHFQQHVVEMSFADEVVIEGPDELKVLEDKLTNNLMQWHSAWSLLIDCSKLRINPELEDSFQRLERKFRGFFLKKIIGYSPASKGESYPFAVFRSRHRAAAELESEGLFSGEDAQCLSKKQQPPQ